LYLDRLETVYYRLTPPRFFWFVSGVVFRIVYYLWFLVPGSFGFLFVASLALSPEFLKCACLFCTGQTFRFLSVSELSRILSITRPNSPLTKILSLGSFMTYRTPFIT